jgi:superfamily II DNA or RNA helicase
LPKFGKRLIVMPNIKCRYRSVYRSDTGILGHGFYDVLLPESIHIMRAVGYFSASVFSVSAKGFIEFFRNGGKYSLITSDQMFRPEIEAIYHGMVNRRKVRSSLDELSFWSMWTESKLKNNEILTWLVASDFVRVKIAIRSDERLNSIYHEKIGVSKLASGRIISWSGSSNESINGWVKNFERIDVFDERADQHSRKISTEIYSQFKKLWSNQTEGLQVIPFYDALKRHLIYTPNEERSSQDRKSGIREVVRNNRGVVMKLPEEIFAPPDAISLYDHQKSAIKHWISNKGTGVLEMATGSGKTITALSLANTLWDAMGDRSLTIIIVAPYIALVDQWIEVCNLYGLKPIKCAEGYYSWSTDLDTAIIAMNMQSRKLLSLCVTSATLRTESFQKLLSNLKGNCLIIADEVHNYGTKSAIESFPISARFRLGLSATPWRAFDKIGSERIREYFGDIVFSYTLSDALKDEVLTHYNYYPVFTSLEQDELDVYLELTHELSKYLTGDENEPVSTAGMSLLIKRARLIGSAHQKIPLLKRLLEKYKSETHILVYCGDGRVETDIDSKSGANDDQNWVRQIEEVVRIVGKELKMTCASFTAETTADRRAFILREFEKGIIQVIVAIRCLDEGIDIPATRTAFILASSSNPRQFVQRRGRLLRKSVGKNRAEIYDFYVDPPHSYFPPGSSDFQVMRRLYTSQISRAREFIDLADNGVMARREFREITNYYALHTAWEAHDE